MVIVGACAEQKGALMLAINTDMKAPKDVNAVSVSISSNGALKYSFIGRVTPQGEVLLPATLAIVEPEDKNASIRIRVMAFQDKKARVLRDVRTTVPTGGRTALLRVPLNFVSDNSAVGAPLPDDLLPAPLPGTGLTLPDGGSQSINPPSAGAGDFDYFGAFQPPCPDIEHQTIIDGECKDSYVDPSTLPDFDPGLVGDGTDPGTCFDLARCFGTASPLPEGALDSSTCALSLGGADPATLNLALVTPDTGDCLQPGACYVPLDRGAGGWQESNGRVQLPPFVCKLLTGKSLRLVRSDGACGAKAEQNPVCTAKPGAFVDSGASNGPRRIVAEDYVTQTFGLLDGRLFVTAQSGLGSYASVGFDAQSTPKRETILAGDGTVAPRSVFFTSTTLDSYAFSEGSHVYLARKGAIQRLDFDAQVIGVGYDPQDFVVATSKRAGDSVFRVALAAEGPARPVFTNTTGKLVTSGVGLQQEGFAVAFDDGTLGRCAGLTPCTQPTYQTFPGVGRIDAFLGSIDTSQTTTFGVVHHSQGLTRLDILNTTLQAVPIVTADLSGYTQGGSYYPRGLATNARCVYYASAKDEVHVRNLATQADVVLATAPGPILSIGAINVGGAGGPLYVTWAVFGPASAQGGVWAVPVPPECDVRGQTSDAGTTTEAGVDAASPSCPTTAPIDATVLPWKSPAVALGSCTQLQLDALVTFVNANPAADFQAWKNSVVDPTCGACIFGSDAGTTWTPVVSADGIALTEVNVGGCIARSSGSDLCGKAYQQWFDCSLQACAACPAGDTPALTACRNAANGGACKSAAAAIIAVCGQAVITAAETACQAGTTYSFEGPVRALCIAGP
jgi:hypothetical protein